MRRIADAMRWSSLHIATRSEHVMGHGGGDEPSLRRSCKRGRHAGCAHAPNESCFQPGVVRCPVLDLQQALRYARQPDSCRAWGRRRRLVAWKAHDEAIFHRWSINYLTPPRLASPSDSVCLNTSNAVIFLLKAEEMRNSTDLETSREEPASVRPRKTNATLAALAVTARLSGRIDSPSKMLCS